MFAIDCAIFLEALICIFDCRPQKRANGPQTRQKRRSPGPALLFVRTIRLANSFAIYRLLFFHFTLPKKIMLDWGLYFMK